MVSYYFFQLMNDLVLYNLNDCIYYGYSITNHSINAVVEYSQFKLWQGTLQIFYIVHKMPVAMNHCIALKETYNDLNNTVNWFKLESLYDTAYSLTTNLIFNFGDLMQEASTLYSAVRQRNWALVGSYLAKMTSDVIVKSPIRNSWNVKNSESISGRMTSRTSIDSL